MVSYASNISHPKHLSTRAAPASPNSRSPIFLYNCLNPGSVQELPLPAPQLLSKQESGLEGGRKVHVDLNTFVGPDPELYMTE